MKSKRIAQLHTIDELQDYLDTLQISLPFDETVLKAPDSPLSKTFSVENKTIGNRLAVLPMEGWDGNTDGSPSELTERRWRRFGRSGAKLIFGGEAVAVRADCRANPRGLIINENTLGGIEKLRKSLVNTHAEYFDSTSDMIIGLQLTHAGRFTVPFEWDKPERKTLYHHPILDRKFGIDSSAPVMSDDEIKQLVDDFVRAAVLAKRAGFDFVDVKHCHGYLGHEFLSAVDRPGPYGGSLENRSRFLREVVAGIKSEAPGLQIGIRLSAFDFVPFETGANGEAQPAEFSDDYYRYGFGGDGSGTGIDISEPLKFLDIVKNLGIRLVCITASSAYYTYHVIRPCSIPAKGSYPLPEDPLVGVARLINTTAQLKKMRPELIFVGSGYSYLQEWLPNFAQHVIRNGKADFVGIGRMVLCYPEMIADVLAGKPLKKDKICRSCSRCTTAPRYRLISGCYLTDDFYKSRPEYKELSKILQSA